MQNGIPVGLRSSPSFGLSRSGQLTAIIQSLFWDGSQGWWYDDNDLTTLFQDSAGTTPVTAVEQFVGLQLDKSKGLVLGPELVTNGDFSNGTTGWTDVTATLSVSSGEGLVTAASAFGYVRQTLTTVVGRTYLFTLNARIGTTNRITFAVANGAVVAETTSATATALRCVYTAAATTTNIWLQVNNAGTGFFDNISVRELPGNHRYAPASGNRPIWSKRVNLLTKTEQFNDAAWTKSNATVTANATIAPDGTLTADKLVEGATTSRKYINQTGASVAQTFSVYVQKGERDYVAIGQTNGAGLWAVSLFNLNLGTYVASYEAGASALPTNNTIISVGGNWYKISCTLNGGGGLSLPVIMVSNGGNPIFEGYTGDGTSGIFIWGADLRPTNQATGTMPLYQRVNTSTDYDTNGFPGYLKADGVDDFLQTNTINFTSTDKITLCAGVRKLSDATVQILYELSANLNTNSGTFFAAPGYSGLGVGAYWTVAAKGTVQTEATTTATFAAPQTAVQTQVADISGDSLLLRINGAQVASSSSNQGTGNFGNYPAYFFRRAGTSFPFNGYEYGNIAVGKLLTADQLTALETYMNGLTKAY